MTSRIHRGFHRIGIVLAAPLLLLGIGLAGHEAWLQWTTKDPWAAFPIVEPAPKRPSNPFDKFDLPSDAKPDAFADLDPRPPAYRADYTIAGISLALALTLYTAARAVGWVLVGFIGPNSRS